MAILCHTDNRFLSHFERSKKDIKDGRVLLAEEAIESVADELISFSCLNENGRGRSQTTTGTKKNNKKSEKALSQADFPKNPVISFSVLRAKSVTVVDTISTTVTLYLLPFRGCFWKETGDISNISSNKQIVCPDLMRPQAEKTGLGKMTIVIRI